MKKLLIVTKYFKFGNKGGGAQKSVELLYDKLKEDFKVDVICQKTKYTDKNIFSLSEFLISKKGNYEIIYLNSFFSPLSIFFILFYNKNLIISPKGEFYPGALNFKRIKKHIWIYVFNFFYKKKINFHFTSQDEEKITNKKIFPSNSQIAPDIIEFNFKPREVYNSGNLEIVFISRIENKKNLLFCIKVLSRVNRELSFNIYGDIGDKAYFKKCMKQLKFLPNNIKWRYNGELDSQEIHNVFLRSDLFFFPTLGENFGYVIMESLSSYCPVLLSKNTTIFNNLDKYKIGSNIPLNDGLDSWVNFIEGFQRVKTNSDMEQFKNYLCNKFDTQDIVSQNLNIFRNVAKE